MRKGRADLKTPAGDAGVMVTKEIAENGDVKLRCQNNMSAHWFEISFSAYEWGQLNDTTDS
jgi:hypothetical protein